MSARLPGDKPAQTKRTVTKMARPTDRKTRALGLCSGGLDSMLAALVLREQGIEVQWICFETPFFSADKARQAARQTGVDLAIEDITPVYLDMLRNPPAGYGKYMNPCMDCHTLMFKLAGERMKSEGYDFLFSGEVLGQRPMSQTTSSLSYVEKHSGLRGYILRPLSARLLAETLPEQQKLVDRQRLLGLSGRGRKDQIRIAARFGISTYPTPAGGCLLTDRGYSRRLRDLFDHQDRYNRSDLDLLKFGRHLRLSPSAKLIVARNQRENEQISAYVDLDRHITLKVIEHPGPQAVLVGRHRQTVIPRAAAICTGYSKASGLERVSVSVRFNNGAQTIEVAPIRPAAVADLLL